MSTKGLKWIRIDWWPVPFDEKAQALVSSCRYHGWRYSLEPSELHQSFWADAAGTERQLRKHGLWHEFMAQVPEKTDACRTAHTPFGSIRATRIDAGTLRLDFRAEGPGTEWMAERSRPRLTLADCLRVPDELRREFQRDGS